MPASDYKRFLNFLAAHDCALDFREFRTQRSEGRESRSRLEPPAGPATDSEL
jgi:hypothetical protein